MHVIRSTVSIEKCMDNVFYDFPSVTHCYMLGLPSGFLLLYSLTTSSHTLIIIIHSPPPEENVTSGNISVFVKYGVVPYFSKSFDLCKTLDLQCPVKAGMGTVTVKHNIPEFQSLVSL